jgi:putative membrane protein
MRRRLFQFGPMLAAVVALGLVTAASIALAHDRGDHDSGDHHKSGHHHKSHGDHSGGRHHEGDDHSNNGGGDNGVSAWDEEWLMMSIEGDRFEIAGGKIAQDKGRTEEVRNLGKTLVKDHSASLQEAIGLAEKYGIDVPDEPSPTQQWQLRVVKTFSGCKFDKWYSDLEVQDHVQDIQEAKDEVELGCNEEIRDDAKDEIPVLEYHLQLAQEALKSAPAESDSRKS